ncbi:MAG TPA: hypothetical protein VK601_29215, partial [Kofleriaceae bacterium]|nr:hypothetical protein [Kofleriaceae bacterium]
MWNIENTAVNEIAAAGAPARTNLPVSMPVAAPFQSRRAVAGSRRARTRPPTAVAVEAPPSLRDLHELAQASHPEHERLVPTFQMRRRSDVRIVVGKLLLPVAVLVSLGIVVGAYVAFGGDRGASRALAQASVATGAPVAAPAAPAAPVGSPPIVSPAPVEPPPATAPPALVDVRIESTPAGATVMLVDRGRTQL